MRQPLWRSIACACHSQPRFYVFHKYSTAHVIQYFYICHGVVVFVPNKLIDLSETCVGCMKMKQKVTSVQ